MKELTKTRQILQRLVIVMEEVAANDKTLDIRRWYSGYNDHNKTIHTCTAPACVAGYGALDAKLCAIAGINRGNAARLSSMLVEVGYNDYDMDNIEAMVFTSNSLEREKEFEKSFPKENSMLDALHKKSPTPLDVVELLKVIDKQLEKLDEVL